MIFNKNLIKAAVIILMTAAFTISAMATGFIESGMTVDELGSEVQKIMDRYIAKKVPGAAVAIVKDGQIIFMEGYGYADLDEDSKVDPLETVFEYGSINKLFVWVSAMQLVERGELELQVEISEYLPEELMEELNYDKSLTMLDLMNHTAGFEDPMFNFAEKEMTELQPLSDVLIDTEPAQIYEPGEIISYSNYGSLLAAYVIKAISGEYYYNFQRDNIFIPSGIKNISGHPLFIGKPGIEDNKAQGYINESEGEFSEGGWSYIPGYPAGGANGTVEALAKFALSLTPENPGDSPLFDKASTLEKMFTQSYCPNEGMLSVAHGFWEYDGKVKSLGHGGNTAGFTSSFAIAPEERLGLIVLTNVAEETELIYELRKLVFGKIPVDPKNPGLQEPSAKEVEGKYLPARSAYNNILEIFTYLSSYKIQALEEGKIRLSIPGHEATYIQTAPYKYDILDASSSLIKYMYSELYFEKEDSEIKRASSGYSVDLIPMNTFRTTIWFNISIICFSVAIIYYLLFPLIFMAEKIKERKLAEKNSLKNRKVKNIYNLLCLIGFSLVINNFFLLRKAFSNLYLSSDLLTIHFLLNKFLSVFSIILALYLIFNMKKIAPEKNQSLMLLIPGSLLIIFIVLLMNWNFLNLI